MRESSSVSAADVCDDDSDDIKEIFNRINSRVNQIDKENNRLREIVERISSLRKRKRDDNETCTVLSSFDHNDRRTSIRRISNEILSFEFAESIYDRYFNLIESSVSDHESAFSTRNIYECDYSHFSLVSLTYFDKFADFSQSQSFVNSNIYEYNYSNSDIFLCSQTFVNSNIYEYDYFYSDNSSSSLIDFDRLIDSSSSESFLNSNIYEYDYFHLNLSLLFEEIMTLSFSTFSSFSR